MVEFQCRCGQVRGSVTSVTPWTVNRVICYCDDCQAFAHHLGRAYLLNAQGGSDIVQFPPASLTIQQGQNEVAGLRLTPKGLIRWHTTCCNSPIGNTVGPAIPFVGVLAAAFDAGGQRRDEMFGKAAGAINGQYAIGGAPPGSKGMNVGLLMGTIAKILSWRLFGRSWPNPFFDRATGKPLRPVATLTDEQRQDLRRFCGPNPEVAPRA